MDQITEEMKILAGEMAKSTTSTKDLVKDAILNMGPVKLKKALHLFSDADKEIIKECLEELTKGRGPDATPRRIRGTGTQRFSPGMEKPLVSISVEEQAERIKRESAGKEVVDKAGKDKKAKKDSKDVTKAAANSMDSNYSPKKTETNADKMKTESLSGSDDEDEKLMREKNKKQKHQGDNSPAAIEGQVVKSGVNIGGGIGNIVKANPCDMHKTHDDDCKMCKTYKAYKGKKPIVDLEKAKDQGDQNMNEEIKELVDLAKANGISKEDLMENLKENDYNIELVKNYMMGYAKGKSKSVKAQTKALLAEESQNKMAGQDKGEAEKIDRSKGSLEIKAETSTDEVYADLPKMKKSVDWQPHNSLAANSQGRNCHYDVDEYIVKSEEERKELIKNGEYLGEEKIEEVKKSEDQKLDINDILEKGLDYSTNEISRIKAISNLKADGIGLQKSFNDAEIASACGLSAKEAKEILGED